MLFCSKHRLPENHECPFDLRKSSEIEDSFRKLDLLYQDALDFMNKDLTVAKIYEYVTTRKMNNLEATELLTYFIENSEDIDTRRISILAFKVLELRNDYVFNALESCIISDDSLVVKKTAKEVLRFLFPKKSDNVLKWINQKDEKSKPYDK